MERRLNQSDPPNSADETHSKERLLAAFLKCRSLLRRAVGRIVKPDDIDDILQETFVRAYAAVETNEIKHPRSFMLKIARNLALNHVTNARAKTTDIEDFGEREVSSGARSLEAQLEAKEKFLIFCHAVWLLPDQCRRAFVLKKVYGLSQREIAEYLGITESTVEKHVAKGLLMCRKSIEAKGYALDKRAATATGAATRSRRHKADE